MTSIRSMGSTWLHVFFGEDAWVTADTSSAIDSSQF